MMKCPTCDRRPSERHRAASVDDHPEYFNCQDPIHDLADQAHAFGEALALLKQAVHSAGNTGPLRDQCLAWEQRRGAFLETIEAKDNSWNSVR